MKIPYIKSLNVKTVWISPFFKSPQIDDGYDVSDYRDVDPIFGSLQDFKDLVKEFHANDIRVIIDHIPNHTSDQHEWFQKSIKGEAPYDDYYVWHKGKPRDDNERPEVPNNWVWISFINLDLDF